MSCSNYFNIPVLQCKEILTDQDIKVLADKQTRKALRLLKKQYEISHIEREDIFAEDETMMSVSNYYLHYFHPAEPKKIFKWKIKSEYI